MKHYMPFVLQSPWALFRYFVTEVLETIAPPYSQEFVSLFLPLVENEEITGTMDKVICLKLQYQTTCTYLNPG